ncbi:hypothetical protein COW36_08565 [bacterium (Candidatus Blackallbacteria) CG17_big_fil_post_rev_8_21_14_2_50_48_46]|uniref:Lipoprotein n=1 Tax=bacterium (Candidatus Blackallbacteria) CG17_big_fil_post_rev_8_21_14_2_50_48_46 TaxID=2014261 RepID=A0A2M7G6G9_9BACT|nr:MAG: hypothetical protein COW64_05865 [bacterium (Candidatus Blackallbacteria) CG18_big_fil_WC_8_21_14_2_50_49_26]PIW17539.1 MAG: hypothetical protein COW36_08565 [bacterium (Candidatus Blackallbacteria) CG17_big_fil_post_rev_8_21_14_2_50_48_46]PIW48394.1 MAG: hypothetical protein COW20_09915 [bacterium (Candidatus Blackallbacteria) CG13_big_fil_rev_8_21_14_2_50_49_14]
MQLKNILGTLALAAMISPLVACGPTAPLATTSTGQEVQGDKGISGAVTGSKVGISTKIAVYGAFMNVSGNKIDTQNKTIESDTTLAVAPVKDGKYNFALPKAPQKAQGANFKIFAFNDENGNSLYDENELKSKEANVVFAVVGGYAGSKDADGNIVLDILSDFKDFDFKLD